MPGRRAPTSQHLLKVFGRLRNSCVARAHSLRVLWTRTGVRLSHFPEVLRVSDLRGFLLFGWLWLLATSASAQSGGIVLVSDADVPAGITRSVKRRLGQVSDVSDQKQWGSDASDAGFSRIAKRAGAALVVHLRMAEERELQAELRQGGSGAVVATRELPLHGKRFKQPARALSQLVAAAREQLSQGGASAARQQPAANADDALDEEEDPTESQASEPSRERPAEETAPTEGSPAMPSGDSEQIMEDPELSARLSARSDEPEQGPRQGLALQASVGIGPGVHGLRVPTPAEVGGFGEVDTGLAPAVSLAAAAQLGLGPWLLRAEAQYRTFFAGAPYQTQPETMNGVMTQSISSPLTSHSFIIGASPGYRFGGRDSVALMMLMGWTYRSLHASNETLPGVSLRGFVVRPTLHIPFGEVFTLRIAPELIVVQSSETNALGFMATQASGGVGWGAEAAVDVRLAKLLGAGLQYRRSRVSATRSAGDPAIDEEWYVAVQAVLSL